MAAKKGSTAKVADDAPKQANEPTAEAQAAACEAKKIDPDSVVKIAAIEIAENGSAKIAAAQGQPGPVFFETGAGFSEVFGGDESDLGYYHRFTDGTEWWMPSHAIVDPEDQAEPAGVNDLDTMMRELQTRIHEVRQWRRPRQIPAELVEMEQMLASVLHHRRGHPCMTTTERPGD